MADTLIGLRADTWAYTVEIDGIDQGIFDQKEGGDVDSDDSTYKPGAMGDRYSLGGPVTTGNITMRRNYRLHRDHPNSQALINAAGRAAAKIIGQPIDPTTELRFGKPLVWTGKLKRVGFPTHDSQSSDAAMLELEFTIDGKPSGMSGE
jgi:hypothetical protein